MPAKQKGSKMTLLDVQHVKKIYKTRFQGSQVEALKDIHFTVEKGEYVAITELTQQPSKTARLPVSVGRN